MTSVVSGDERQVGGGDAERSGGTIDHCSDGHARFVGDGLVPLDSAAPLGMLMGGAYLIGLLSLIFIVRPKTVPDLAN